MQTTPPAVIPSQKVWYLDHIKVLLTILVVLHHTFITYGASGGWYYKQPSTNMAALVPMTLFVATNQSFFMGMFFLLSAYFIEPSIHRKGTGKYITDRLKRLGIPLLFYSFILSPLLNFMIAKIADHKPYTLLQYLSGYDDWIDFGVLWFVAALLVFTIVYLLAHRLGGKTFPGINLPGFGGIVLFTLALGLLSFAVRMVFPTGKSLRPLGFQLGFFTQYIALFTIGILGRRSNLISQISIKTARKCMWLALILVLVFFPAVMLLNIISKNPFDNFNGGWHWEALSYAVWEQVTGFSIIIALLGFGKERWDIKSGFLSSLSRSSFAVYIFHPLLVIGLALAVHTWPLDPLVKLLIVAPLAVTGSFLLGGLLVRVTGVNKII